MTINLQSNKAGKRLLFLMEGGQIMDDEIAEVTDLAEQDNRGEKSE